MDFRPTHAEWTAREILSNLARDSAEHAAQVIHQPSLTRRQHAALEQLMEAARVVRESLAPCREAVA
jgi:hypothetical protein